jgi:UDP-N-acetylglucosamine:LPS N-acetylglucosamine transferase
VFLGNPVREEFTRLPRKIHIGPFHLLIFGGSQGSRFLNLAVAGALPLLERLKAVCGSSSDGQGRSGRSPEKLRSKRIPRRRR